MLSKFLGIPIFVVSVIQLSFYAFLLLKIKLTFPILLFLS